MVGKHFNREILTPSRQTWLKVSETKRWSQSGTTSHTLLSQSNHLPPQKCVCHLLLWRQGLIKQPENISECILTLDVPEHSPPKYVPTREEHQQNTAERSTPYSKGQYWPLDMEVLLQSGLLCMDSSSLLPWLLTKMPNRQHKGKSAIDKVRTWQYWPLTVNMPPARTSAQ